MGCGNNNNGNGGGNVSTPCVNSTPVICPIDIDGTAMKDNCTVLDAKITDIETRFDNCPQYYTKDDYKALISYLKIVTEQMCFNDKLVANLLNTIINEIKNINQYIQTIQNTINTVVNQLNQVVSCADAKYPPGMTINNECLGINNNYSIAGLTRCEVLDMLVLTASTVCKGGGSDPSTSYRVPTLKTVAPYIQGSTIVGETVTFCVTWAGDNWDNVIQSQLGHYWKVDVINPNGIVVATVNTDNGNHCFPNILLDIEGKWDARVYGVGKKGEILSLTGAESALKGGGGGDIDIYTPPQITNITATYTGTAKQGENIYITAIWDVVKAENIAKAMSAHKYLLQVVAPSGAVVASQYTDSNQYVFTAINLAESGKYCVRVQAIGIKNEQLSANTCDQITGGGPIVVTYDVPAINTITVTPTTGTLNQTVNMVVTWTVTNAQNIIDGYAGGNKYRVDIIDPDGVNIGSRLTNALTITESVVFNKDGKWCAIVNAVGKKGEALEKNSCSTSTGGVVVTYNAPTIATCSATATGTLEEGQSVTISGTWTVTNPTNIKAVMGGKKYKAELLSPTGAVLQSINTDNLTQAFTAITVVEGQYCVRVSAVGLKNEQLTKNSCDTVGGNNGINITYTPPAITQIRGTYTGTASLGNNIYITAIWNVTYANNVAKAMSGKKYKVEIVNPAGTVVSTQYTDSNQYVFTAISLSIPGVYCIKVQAIGVRQEDLNRNTCEPAPQGDGGINVTGTVYYNVRMTRKCTKNNCQTGYTGTEVEYEVMANTYTSYVSQADADSKATADLNANCQNFANQYGTCNQIIYRTITYVPGASSGVTGMPTPLTTSIVNGGSFVVSTTKPTRTGYIFGGWQASDGKTAIYHGGDEIINILGNVNLTAIWTQVITYTVTYAPGATSGVTGMPSPLSTTVVSGNAFTIASAAPARSGYNFGGWQASGGKTAIYPSSSEIQNILANITLTAIWTQQVTHIITYDRGAPTTDTSVANMPTPNPTSVIDGATFTISTTVPTRTGFTFINWAATGGKNGNFASGAQLSNVKDDITLTANWGAIPYEYEIDLDGGNFTGGNLGVGSTSPGTVGYQYTVYAPTINPKKTGYTFNGWIDSATSNKVFTGTVMTYSFVMPARKVTIKATWIAGSSGNGYVMTYVTNSFPTNSLIHGTPNAVAGNPITVPYGTNHTVASMANVTNFNFGGWESSGNTYTAGQVITPSTDMTFTAIWNRSNVNYTITYNVNTSSYQQPNNGKVPTAVSGSPFTLANGDSHIIKSSTLHGYTLLGWSKTSNGTVVDYNVGQTLIVEENRSLYAVWQFNTSLKWTVTYNLDGGTLSPTTNPVTNITNGASYTFASISKVVNGNTNTAVGWSKTAVNGTITYNVGESKPIYENITLYPNWGIGNQVQTSYRYGDPCADSYCDCPATCGSKTVPANTYYAATQAEANQLAKADADARAATIPDCGCYYCSSDDCTCLGISCIPSCCYTADSFGYTCCDPLCPSYDYTYCTYCSGTDHCSSSSCPNYIANQCACGSNPCYYNCPDENTCACDSSLCPSNPCSGSSLNHRLCVTYTLDSTNCPDPTFPYRTDYIYTGYVAYMDNPTGNYCFCSGSYSYGTIESYNTSCVEAYYVHSCDPLDGITLC